MLLAKLPAARWTDNSGAAARYVAACAAYGLRPVKGGYSSYCSQNYAYLGNAMNVPSGAGSEGGSGSSSDVDDWYHTNGPHWRNFFWFEPNNMASAPLYGQYGSNTNCDTGCIQSHSLSPICGMEY